MLPHFRSFNTTTNECYISFTTCPDFPSEFPESPLRLSILQSGVAFTPSLKWPVQRFPILGTGSASLTQDAVWPAGIFRKSATLCHRYKRNYLFSTSRFAFSINGLFTFSSTVLPYSDHCPHFSLPLTTHWFSRLQLKLV